MKLFDYQLTLTWRVKKPFLFFVTAGRWFAFSMIFLPYMEGLVSESRLSLRG